MQLGYAWRLQNSQERQEELDRWREGFNKSTHVSLKNVSPAKAYGRKSVQGSLPVVLLDYPGLERRRVGKGGGISLNGHEHFLSTALAGWDVALKEIADGRLEVRFAQASLGILDPEKVEFTPAANAIAQVSPAASTQDAIHKLDVSQDEPTISQ
ncbi:MAG: hypothetical protein ACOYM3_24655 [Terrimicrobiaceae bacterium]